jgi:TatD DNase family protein
MIDTHAHLDDEQFAGDRDEVLRSALCAGVSAIVCPSVSRTSAEALLALAGTIPSDFEPRIYVAVAIHPNYCIHAAADDFDRIVALAEHRAVVAIGEMGLDRYWDTTPFPMQVDFFRRHLLLSQERDLPIIIHCREAEADLLPLLKETVVRAPLRGVLHSFSGNSDFAAQCLGFGLDISFSGNVTYKNKKFEPLREAARMIPADRIMIETDSPYLSPEPLRGKQPRNEPANVAHIAAFLANLRGQPIEQFIVQTTDNARRLFRLAEHT